MFLTKTNKWNCLQQNCLIWDIRINHVMQPGVVRLVLCKRIDKLSSLSVFWTIWYVIQEAALASACRLKCNTKYYDDKINGHIGACHSVSFSFCSYVCKCVSRYDYIAETKRPQKDSQIWNHLNCVSQCPTDFCEN